MAFLNERRIDGLCIAALWLLLALLLGKALLPGWVLLPLDIVNNGVPPWQGPNQAATMHNSLLEDAVFYIYPVKAWTAAQVRQGVLPLWSPELFGGYPAIYDTQAGLFYPLSLLYYLLDGATAVDLTIFLQMGLGATFMFLYLRRLRLRRVAALLGAVVFIGNGLMVVWLEWQVVHAAVIWLPLALYAVEREAEGFGLRSARRIPHAALLFALAFALPWLGGHWNWALYGSITAVLYRVWRLWPLLWGAWRAGRAWRAWRAWRAGLSSVALPVVLGGGLALIQVLPAFAFLLQSHRQSLTWTESQQYGLLNRFVALVIPDFFGTPLAGNWWGFDNYNETALYVGILPLLLVGAAVWLGRGRPATRFWLAWGGVGLLWTLGPGYVALYWLPVFNGLLPSRAAVLVVTAAAVLAAIGLDHLLDHLPVGRRAGWLWGGAAALLLLVGGYLAWYWGQVDWGFLQRPLLTFTLLLLASALLLWARWRGWARTGWFGGLALALTLLDLLLAGYGYNTLSPTTHLYPPTETAAFLHTLPPTTRITSLAEGMAYRPNTALAAGVPSLSGYGPGIARRLVAYLRAAEGGEVIRLGRVLLPLRAIESPLFDAIGVSHVVTTQDLWGDEAAAGGTGMAVVDWTPLDGAQRRPLAVGQAGLFRVDVPLRAETGAQGEVTLRLFTADGVQELAHHALPVGEVTEAAWVSFYFSLFPSEWGDTFLAELHFNGTGAVAVGRADETGWAYTSFVRLRPGLLHEAGKTRVYANAGDLGRAFVVSQAVVVADEVAALTAVQENAVQLGQVVVLELEGKPAPPATKPQESAPGIVTILEAGVNRVTLRAEMTSAGFVVLADAYDAGWRAMVSGQPAPVYRANTVVRAVYVPAGAHEIIFQYWPMPFIIGAIVSGLTLLGALLGLWWGKRP